MSERRFTIGLTVEHFDFRVDLHRFIEALGRRADVVVLTDRAFATPVTGLKEVRLFRSRSSPTGRAALRMFHLLRRIPKSRDNFFITEAFKIAALPLDRQRRAMRMLRWRRACPIGLPVDCFLPWLGRLDVTPIDDLDAFLHITQIGALPLLARALRSGKPNVAYIYSWDHPCKHTTIPRRGIATFLTWNRAISEDMTRLQGSPPGRLTAIGATQLAPLKQYLETPAARTPLPGDYIYFGCGTGQGDLVRQELLVIRWLARQMRTALPATTLLVRPYPLLSDWSPYEALLDEPNLQLDRFRTANSERALSSSQVFEKYRKIEHARAVAHAGTTLGWEACYFDAPVMFLAPEDLDFGVRPDAALHLNRFIHQYHCQRYLELPGYENVITNSDGLSRFLSRLQADPASCRAYNRAVAAETPLRGLDEIAEETLQALRAAAAIP